jgi:putative transposase
VKVLEWNHDHDHVHVLFKAHPNSEISKFLWCIQKRFLSLDQEGVSAHSAVALEGAFLVKKLLFTVDGGVSIDITRVYIESQGEPG